jgi:hypothetical protein
MRSITTGAGIVLATGIISLFARPAAGDDAASLLSKHKAFVGWQAGDGTFTSLKLGFARARRTLSAAASPEPNPAPLRPSSTEYRRGLAYRDVSKLGGGLSTEEGFTGTSFWTSNVNHNSTLVLGRDAQRLYTENLIDSEAIGQLPAAIRGQATIDGRSATVIRITPKVGTPADISVDPQTGAFLRVAIDPESPHESIDYDIVAYGDALPGKKIPIAIRTNGGGTDETVVSIEPNVTIPDDDLRAPKPLSSWTFGSMDPWPIEIVSQGDAGKAVHVRASINGREGTFLLDSGASGIIVFRPFADTLDLKELRKSGYYGVNGGFVRSTEALASSISIGSNVLSNVVVDIASHNFETIDGILGYDFLANALVDVNLADHTLTIADPSKFDPTIGKGAYAFPVDLSGGSPEVTMTLGNGIVTHPVFDTGNDFFVLLSDQLRSSGKVVALTDTIHYGGYEFENRIYFGGVDGTALESAPCIRLNSVNVGPYRYEQAATCFGSPRVFGEDRGLIGFDFLRHFNWTFDYPHNKLVLTPNGN